MAYNEAQRAVQPNLSPSKVLKIKTTLELDVLPSALEKYQLTEASVSHSGPSAAVHGGMTDSP